MESAFVARTHLSRPKVHREAIYAVPLPGRARSISEDMPKMTAAICTMHFCARITDLVICAGCYSAAVNRLPEARPACPAVILGLGRIQRIATARTDERSLALLIVERGGKGRLCSGLAQDAVFRPRETFAPFLVTKADRKAFGVRRGCAAST